MGVLGKAGRAAAGTLISSNPVTRAASQVLGALGIGSVRNARGESLTGLKKAIAQGDWATVKRKAANSKWAKVRGIAQTALASGVQDYQANKAAYYAEKSGWPSSNGRALPAASSNQPVSRQGSPSPTRSPSAPGAKKRKAVGAKAPPKGAKASTSSQGRRTLTGVSTARPCAYGPRDAMGRCPKAPCKYGPRDAQGRCPPAPRMSATDKAVERTINKAATAGATAAAGAARTIYKAVGPGVIVSTVAKAGLVVGAGLAAYYLTSQLMKLRYKTYAELRYEASNAYRRSRQAAEAELGRPLTPSELSQFARYYKARIDLLNRYEAAGQPISGVVNLTFED